MVISLLRLFSLGTGIRWEDLRLDGFPHLEFGFLALAGAAIRFQGGSLGVTFLSFLLLTASHAGFSGNSPHLSLLRWPLLGLWLLSFGLACKRRDIGFSGVLTWFREFVPLYSLVLVYPLIPLIMAASNPGDLDPLLWSWDRLLFGADPHGWLEQRVPAVLLEWMALCYSLYGFLFLGVLGSLMIRRSEAALREMVFRACVCLASGYTLYWMIPAAGPESVVPFEGPLELVHFASLKEILMDRPRIERDCFPSLHTAITAIVLGSAWSHLRFLFWIILPVAFTVPFACIALRYHYVVDVLAGLLLAIATLIPWKRWFNSAAANGA